jgi:hypothetical protein
MTRNNGTVKLPKVKVNRAPAKADWSYKRMLDKIPRLVRRLGLDRRRVYTVGYFNELAVEGRVTTWCSGCRCESCDGRCSHPSAGCRECGFTGKRIERFPDPVMVNDEMIQLAAPPEYP